MFDGKGPHVFYLPPGADFPAQLVAGLQDRMAARTPDAMARIKLYVNTARMRRRIIDLFAANGSSFLPQILLITELAGDPSLGMPPATSPLRRRLELAQLIGGLLNVQPDLAPRATLFDLADSLATLMDEMQGEGVLPETVAGLDVSNHSEHWKRTQAFLQIVAPLFTDSQDDEARLRQAVVQIAAQWHNSPTIHPVIVAGSTGSRGTTAAFMAAVAALPQGALVLPGFDPDTPPAVWSAMKDAITAEDHPQFRYRKLMDALKISPNDITLWRNVTAPNPQRNQLISLSLRPAPVTDQWLIEGPGLADLQQTTSDLTLIEAASPRDEALAIALILRKAAEDGTKSALISPDRNLTRQVTAALDRWGILPDDSAGKPLALSAPGRFLSHVVQLFSEKLTADRLLTVLKHPLTATGGERGQHLLFTRYLELKLRKHGPTFPTGKDLTDWADTRAEAGITEWAQFLALAFDQAENLPRCPLAHRVTAHIQLAETLARGTAIAGSGALWDKAAGAEALAMMANLVAEAPHGGAYSAMEYRDLFTALLNKGEVREAVQSHPNIMVWGTIEARVQGADLVILGGLNDAIWPKMPEPDPWLNRQMRKSAGLLLPERQVGLSAHDYQQAVAAPRVVLSRAVRNADAETVPSRWLNRLLNLMEGLPQKSGPEAVAEMRKKGLTWLEMAQDLKRPSADMLSDSRLQPAKRPAPQPPVSTRPEKLSLTNIAKLIRDPYAIYARHILRLYPLDPLRATPDARERGKIVHLVLEQFVKSRPIAETRIEARHRLLTIAKDVLNSETAFPSARTLWLARLERAANHFLTQDAKWGGTALAVETQGSVHLDGLNFTLFGTPDRIDRLPDGSLHLIDYKNGSPPSATQQKTYEKQLLLAAAMAERGGFTDFGPSNVSSISYVGLGAGEKAVDTEMTPDTTAEVWAKLITLISRYLSRTTGYTSRRAMFETRYPGDYDHLARFGEWQMSDNAVPAPVGPEDGV